MRVPAVPAVQMRSVAVGWQVYDISHDPLSLGRAAACRPEVEMI